MTQNPIRVLAIANQKGGVGKTTTAINLGTALAAAGSKVVLFDIDPQGNASTGLGIARADRSVGAYQVLLGEARIDQCLARTSVPGLSVVAADPDLAGAEIELSQAPRRNFRLRDAIDALGRDPTARPDFVLVDCPPSLTLLTINALAAAQGVVVPLQCEFFALEGLSQLLRTIELVRGSLNPNLDVHGVVLTMHDRRTNLTEQVEADVRSHLGAKVFDTVIPRNVRVSEAPSFGKPVLLYDHTCAASDAYIRLAREVLQRERAAA